MGPPAFSSDSHLLAAATTNDAVRVWDVTHPDHTEVVAHIPADEAAVVAFQPGTHMLAVARSDGSVQLWNLADPANAVRIASLAGSPGTTAAVIFSPDGHLLATGAPDRTTRLWNVSDPITPQLVSTLTGVQRPVAFHPDGHTLAVITGAGTVGLRETDPDRSAAQLCARTPPMTTAAWNQYFPDVSFRAPCP